MESARLFRNGRSQAVRIPKEFEFDGDNVTIRKEGEGRFVIERWSPNRTGQGLIEYLRSMQPIDELWEDPNDDDLLSLDEIDL